MRMSTITRRAFLSFTAAAAPFFANREARASRILEEEMISPLYAKPRILLYPGHDHWSWGVPKLGSVRNSVPGVGLFHYNIPRVWSSDLYRLSSLLQEHLDRGEVVLVGYSKGACAALDVVVNAELPATMLARLHLLLVAPAAKVRRIPTFLRPACIDIWAQRWQEAEAQLIKRVNHSEQAWCSFLDQRVRLIYSTEDVLIDPRGHERLRDTIPRHHVRELIGLRKHLAWLKRREVVGEVLEMLGEQANGDPTTRIYTAEPPT